MGAPQRQGTRQPQGNPPAGGSPRGPGDPQAQGGYEWMTLDPDEQVLWEGQPHAYSLIPAIVIGIPLVLLLIGVLVIVGAILQRRNTTFLVTTDGLYKKTGIISRDVQKIEFGKVQNISFSQGPLGNLVGYGNVDISTAGGSGVEMQFRSVPDPKSVQEQINRQIRQSRPEGASDESGGRSGDAVVDEILTELRAIRRAVEGEGTAASETSSTRDTSQQGGTQEQHSGHDQRHSGQSDRQNRGGNQPGNQGHGGPSGQQNQGGNTGQGSGQGGNQGRGRNQNSGQGGNQGQGRNQNSGQQGDGGASDSDQQGDGGASDSDQQRDWDDE